MKNHLKKKSKVLCIGCGNGFEVIEYLNQGHDAYGTEVHPIEGVKPLEGRIINAVVPDLPFKDKEFDFLHCTEVLEHIPEETTNEFLTECKRVSGKQFFSIATRMDDELTHINIQTPGWWLEKFEDNQFNVANFQFKPLLLNIYGEYPFNVHYTDGITVLCDLS
jgi:2-polyprenyl-3-methyl-5-hydroxy-6-metoxy-1,4-benzoquinol methylase